MTFAGLAIPLQVTSVASDPDEVDSDLHRKIAAGSFHRRMKRCQYCGKTYADKLTVCPADGQPLIDPEAAASRAGDPSMFRAGLSAPASRAGKYQVYVRGGDLIFILTESARFAILNSIHGFLGPFGVFIPLALWLFSQHQPKDRKQRLEAADPEDLIRDDERNFRLHLSEIREATLDPASFWRLSRIKAVACLTLLVRQNERLKLELSSPADVAIIRRLISPKLAGILKDSLGRLPEG